MAIHVGHTGQGARQTLMTSALGTGAKRGADAALERGVIETRPSRGQLWHGQADALKNWKAWEPHHPRQHLPHDAATGHRVSEAMAECTALNGSVPSYRLGGFRFQHGRLRKIDEQAAFARRWRQPGAPHPKDR